MPVELLIAPPASGKTAAGIQRLRLLTAERAFAPARVVLPDRLQTSAFRRRLAEAGGSLGVQVGTFGDLYRELLDLAGQPIPVASPPMLHRLVQLAVDQVHSAGLLQKYGGLRETPGFALSLRDIFAELKRYLVYPQDFLSEASGGSTARQELAQLYDRFQAQLHNLNWADPEGLSWLAVAALEKNPNLPIHLDLLIVDGFDSFNGAQLRALELLQPVVSRIVVTLPGELPFRRIAHRRFNEAYLALSARLHTSGHGLESHPFLPGSLRHLEKCLFETESGYVDHDDHITMLEARSPAEEAREALRWMKAHVVRDGIPLHTCAIVTPDPDLYHPYLRQAAVEMGIPLHFTQGEVLIQSPAIAALTGLLSLPVMNYPRRLVLDALRSPYFDLTSYGFNRRTVDILDAASRFGMVVEGRDQWYEALVNLAQKPTPSIVEEEDEIQVPIPPEGEQAAPLYAALRRFFERLEPSFSSLSLSEWICWLEDLLGEWHYFENGAGARDLSAFEALRQTLRSLVISESITGIMAFSYAQFINELQGALQGSGYQEPLPSGQSAALVLNMMEARGVRFHAVAIVGLSEGIFPAVERPDPFLDESLRDELKLESRLQREQPGLFYQAVTRANRFLLLTRPYLADDGEKWEASPYWKTIVSLLNGYKPKTIRPDDTRSLDDAASAQELLFWAVRRHSLPQAFVDLLPRWHYLRHASGVLRSRQKNQSASRYEGYSQELESIMQTSYGERHIWSVTRLESYGTCPFQFFVNNSLKLEAKAEPELGLNAAQLGTILHKILELVYEKASDPGDPAAVLAVLPEIAGGVFESAPQELGFRPSLLWEIERINLLQRLEAAITGLAGGDSTSGWYPFAFEQVFGVDANPLEVKVDGHTIRLHGVIDRIDRDPAGRLRIVDYKTGSGHQSAQDLVQGRRLQLPVYALAAQSALGFGEVIDGLYWGLLSGEAGSLRLGTFRHGEDWGIQAAVDVALGHLGRIIKGIRLAQFPPMPPKGGCPAYCNAGEWCWHYRPGW